MFPAGRTKRSRPAKAGPTYYEPLGEAPADYNTYLRSGLADLLKLHDAVLALKTEGRPTAKGLFAVENKIDFALEWYVKSILVTPKDIVDDGVDSTSSDAGEAPAPVGEGESGD